MPNLKDMFETAAHVIGSFADNEIPPLHVGEVMSCWAYLAFISQIIVYEEVALNTTTDKELKDSFEEALQIAKSHQQQMSDFLQHEGVPLPASSEVKPISEAGAIPMGAKFTDNELVNALAINLVMAVTMCAGSASQSLRSDVGAIFLKFQLDKMALGAKLKFLMKKRGWLKIPPYYHPPGSPN